MLRVPVGHWQKQPLCGPHGSGDTLGGPRTRHSMGVAFSRAPCLVLPVPVWGQQPGLRDPLCPWALAASAGTRLSVQQGLGCSGRGLSPLSLPGRCSGGLCPTLPAPRCVRVGEQGWAWAGVPGRFPVPPEQVAQAQRAPGCLCCCHPSIRLSPGSVCCRWDEAAPTDPTACETLEWSQYQRVGCRTGAAVGPAALQQGRLMA